ncbi:Uncharacterised protein [BD1-7 clade bacterium]|uniref:SMODS and SLOG-associating 2TM effector domain-containing protein n=1 Tax=BD1-7 clade bacterium TaxID=2029982 RepID=A0A5S9NNS9_9GAMM|nr:Uncharacterised protein [BD1-7 clade bacterium]
MQEYLSERVQKQRDWYELRANDSKQRFLRNQTVIIVLGAVIPLTVTIASFLGHAELGAVISAGISCGISIIAGLDKLHQPQTAWFNSRAYEESLKKEEWFYRYRAGDYNGLSDRDAEVRFIENVEGIISADIARRPASHRNGDKRGDVVTAPSSTTAKTDQTAKPQSVLPG